MQENLLLTSSKTVDNLCSILKHLGIDLFHHVRVYEDNSRFSLCNHVQLSSYLLDFYLHQYSKSDLSYVNTAKKYEFILCDAVFPDNKVIQWAKKNLNTFYNPCLIVKEEKKYSDFFYFGSSIDKVEIVHLCLNERNLLERFILYFKDAASNLILAAEKNRFCPKIKIVHKNQEEPIIDSIKLNEMVVNNFLKNTKAKRFYINEHYLTLSEMKCLKWLAFGKTFEEIASILNISTRTVINHIENIKMKMNCHKQTQLVKLAIKSRIDEYVDI